VTTPDPPATTTRAARTREHLGDDDRLFGESDDEKVHAATNAEMAERRRNKTLRIESEKAEAERRAQEDQPGDSRQKPSRTEGVMDRWMDDDDRQALQESNAGD
jgi:hypothetical protein